jgi:hypothetical protein
MSNYPTNPRTCKALIGNVCVTAARRADCSGASVERRKLKKYD